MKKLFYLLPFMLAVACQPNTGNQQPDSAAPAAEPTAQPAATNPIKDFFEEQIVVKMHLFATQEQTPDPETYPYTGKPIEGDALQYLAENLQPAPGSKIYACYHTENNDFYILRIPGVSLALAKWNPATNKLEKIFDLATINCNGKACQQQDVWLTDLDDDRTLELVVNARETDATGKTIMENFMVLAQDGNGNFVQSSEQLAALAVKDRYVLH